MWGRAYLIIIPDMLNYAGHVEIMGILNATPDSFYPASRVPDEFSLSESVKEMVGYGVDIIDIGGESSRPGAAYVGIREEIERVVPAVRAVRSFSGVKISVDTRKSKVAEAALKAGADIINDISALEDDEELSDIIAGNGCDVVLMHKKGTPDTMQENPQYDDVLKEVCEYLSRRIEYAQKKGISRERIIVDPGFGFGKRHEDNLALLAHLDTLKETGCRVLVGLSRKSIIGNILENKVDDRLNGTVVANTLAVISGADIIRVHDVKQHMEMKKIIEAVIAAGDRYGSA